MKHVSNIMYLLLKTTQQQARLFLHRRAHVERLPKKMKQTESAVASVSQYVHFRLYRQPYQLSHKHQQRYRGI